MCLGTKLKVMPLCSAPCLDQLDLLPKVGNLPGFTHTLTL